MVTAEVTPVTLYDYAQQLSDEGIAYNTIRGRIDKISHVFKYAVRKGIVTVNLCLGLKLQG
jgi:site-specific recombinase XerD